MLLTKDRVTDLRMPDVDVKLPTVKFPDIEMPEIDLGQARSDIGKAISSAVAGTRLERQSSPSRWPLAVVGLVVAGVATWAILTSDGLRERIVDAVMSIRRAIAVQWSGTGSKPIDPVAFDAAPTAPIDRDAATTDLLYAGVTDYPDGLGSKGTPRANGETIKVR